jgi:hypothetical protein
MSSVCVEDVKEQTRTLRDEAMAAEYVATEETLENVGTALDALERLEKIRRKYWEVFLSDQLTTFEALTKTRSLADFTRVGFEHWNRRISHGVDAYGETVGVLSDEAHSFVTTFFEMWRPFIEMVRRDARSV